MSSRVLCRRIGGLFQQAAFRRATTTCPRVGHRVMASAAPTPPSFYILEYKYIPDILEKRGPYRQGHLSAANDQFEKGKLVMAGAFGDPVEGGVFIFKDTSKEEIEEYVKNDVYVLNGLVPSWSIKPYMVAVGP